MENPFFSFCFCSAVGPAASGTQNFNKRAVSSVSGSQEEESGVPCITGSLPSSSLARQWGVAQEHPSCPFVEPGKGSCTQVPASSRHSRQDSAMRFSSARRTPKFRGIRFTSVKATDAPVLRAEIAVLLAKDAIEPVPPADMGLGIVQPPLHCAQESWWVTTYLGSASFEPCTSQAAVQDVDAETHFWVRPSPRLVCSYKPEGCVFLCPDPPTTQAVPVILVGGSGISVQGPAFHAVPVTLRLHQSRGGGPCPSERTGFAHSQLPRRLAHTCTVSQAVVCTQGPGAQAPQPAGPSGQLGKEQTRANAEDLFSRHGVGFG